MSNFREKKFDKLSKDEKIGLMIDLINAFRIVKKPYETALFLQDLLTANEIRNLSIRLRIAKLILAGKTHREIQDSLHSSLATITKVRAWLDEGGEGLKSVVSKLPLKWKVPDNLPNGPIEFHLPQTLIALGQYGVAKSKDKQVEKFIKGVESRENIDKSLRKHFDEFYKEKAMEKKYRKVKKDFDTKIRERTRS